MSLADEYVAQERWRMWDAMLDRLPLRADQTVLDLGCGPGAVAARLAERAARVVAIDRDPDLLAIARARCPDNCRFVGADLGKVLPPGLGPAHGIWSSFLAAYFPRLDRVLPQWLAHLKPGGWIALVEVDRMWTGHRPLTGETRLVLERFATLGCQGGFYDPDMGSKLDEFLQRAGLQVGERTTWPDAELAFQGPARPEVLEAWRRRFARMPAFRRWLGDAAFAKVRDEFLACLAADDHAADAAVVMVVARKHCARSSTGQPDRTRQRHAIPGPTESGGHRVLRRRCDARKWPRGSPGPPAVRIRPVRRRSRRRHRRHALR